MALIKNVVYIVTTSQITFKVNNFFKEMITFPLRRKTLLTLYKTLLTLYKTLLTLYKT